MILKRWMHYAQFEGGDERKISSTALIVDSSWHQWHGPSVDTTLLSVSRMLTSDSAPAWVHASYIIARCYYIGLLRWEDQLVSGRTNSYLPAARKWRRADDAWISLRELPKRIVFACQHCCMPRHVVYAHLWHVTAICTRSEMLIWMCYTREKKQQKRAT